MNTELFWIIFILGLGDWDERARLSCIYDFLAVKFLLELSDWERNAVLDGFSPVGDANDSVVSPASLSNCKS